MPSLSAMLSTPSPYLPLLLLALGLIIVSQELLKNKYALGTL
jgi:hypothetical protein